jgi:lysophospholipase L1-like esterase
MTIRIPVVGTENRLQSLRPRRQLVSTRCHVPYELPPNLGSYTVHETRVRMVVGPSRCSDLQFVYPNWYLDFTSGELDIGNSVTLKASFNDGSSFWRLRFNGVRTPVMESGATLISDPVGVTMAAGASIWVHTAGTVSAGNPVAAGPLLVPGADEYFARHTSTDRVDQVATFDASNGIGGNGARGLVPMAVLGVPETPFPAVAILGDSITAAVQDGTASPPETVATGGYFGYLARGLATASSTGGYMPFMYVAEPGTGSLVFTNALSPRALNTLSYCTHMICALGTNDLIGANAATTLGLLQNVWRAAKARGLVVYQSLILPRTTGTYTSAAGQTVVSQFLDGRREQLNTLILNEVGRGLLDGVINPNPFLEDPAAPGKWRSDVVVTADGVHPNSVAHALAAPAVAAVARTFTV